MENIFPNSRCLSLSVPGPHHDCQWKGQLGQVWEHLSGPLSLLLEYVEGLGEDVADISKENVAIIYKERESTPHISPVIVQD